MDESYAIMRYELKGHDRDYYCLVRDAESQGPFSLNEYTALTTGFLSEYQGDEGITCFVRGDLTFLEKFDAHTLNANSPFSVQQRRNIQMAFDNLEPGMCLEAARAFAERHVDSWTAFEVCAAMRDYFPKQLSSRCSMRAAATCRCGNCAILRKACLMTTGTGLSTTGLLTPISS